MVPQPRQDPAKARPPWRAGLHWGPGQVWPPQSSRLATGTLPGTTSTAGRTGPRSRVTLADHVCPEKPSLVVLTQHVSPAGLRSPLHLSQQAPGGWEPPPSPSGPGKLVQARPPLRMGQGEPRRSPSRRRCPLTVQVVGQIAAVTILQETSHTPRSAARAAPPAVPGSPTTLPQGACSLGTRCPVSSLGRRPPQSVLEEVNGGARR